MKVASHFGKLFGGLLKANKAKIKHKLGARNTTPGYKYKRNVHVFLKYTKNVHSSTTENNPKEEESNIQHQQSDYVNCGAATQWSKERVKNCCMKNVDGFHKYDKERRKPDLFS